jgi:hypothetical protein
MERLGKRGIGEELRNLLEITTKSLLLIVSFLIIYLVLALITNNLYALLEAIVMVIIIGLSDYLKIIIRLGNSIGFSLAGSLIPLIFSTELFIRTYSIISKVFIDLLVSIAIAIAINYLNSIRYDNIGVLLGDLMIPILLIASMNTIIILRHNIPYYYSFILSLIISSFSSFIGLDLLNMKGVRVNGKTYVFGGNHLLDAVFLETFLSPGVSFAILYLSIAYQSV